METKTKVLIVDDEVGFCKPLKAFLEKKGYETEVATDGDQALEKLEKEKPDIMTLDIRMPGIDGYEVLKKAKAISEKVCVIVVSAIDVPEMEKSFKEKGASAVFYKPVDLASLLETIQKLESKNA